MKKILWLLFVFSISQAQIITYTILEKNGKTVCLYGDYHSRNTLIDAQQCDYIKKLFKQNKHLLSDITILTETKCSDISTLSYIENPIGLVNAFKHEANIICIDDIRDIQGPVLDHLIKLKNLLNQIIDNNAFKEAIFLKNVTDGLIKEYPVLVKTNLTETKILIDNLINKIFDITSLSHILNSNQSKVAVFEGAAHTHYLRKKLIKMGYKMIDAKHYVTTMSGRCYHIPYDIEQLVTDYKLDHRTSEISKYIVPMDLKKFDYIVK